MTPRRRRSRRRREPDAAARNHHRSTAQRAAPSWAAKPSPLSPGWWPRRAILLLHHGLRNNLPLLPRLLDDVLGHHEPRRLGFRLLGLVH